MAKGMVLRPMVITIIVLLSNMSLGTDATVYQVGGVSGGINWRCCDIDYQAWADTITFLPDDVLVFRYGRGVSDVAFVSEEDYKSCLNASLATALITGGTSLRVRLLPVPIHKYYMTTGPNCDKQRFTITMPSNSPPPSESPLPPAQSPSSQSPSAASVPSPSALSVPTPPSDGPISDTNPSPDTTKTPTPDSKSSPPKDAPPNSKNDHKSKSSSKKKKIVIGCVVGGVGITITIGISIKLYFVFGKKSRKKKEKSGAAAAGKKRRAKNTNKDSEATDVEQK